MRLRDSPNSKQHPAVALRDKSWPISVTSSTGDFPWPKENKSGTILAALPWDKAAERFFSALEAFDDYLRSDQPLGVSSEKLFQGPIADALTHVGQIAILRRLAGAPVKGENYFSAGIMAGRVGQDQAAPVQEFQ